MHRAPPPEPGPALGRALSPCASFVRLALLVACVAGAADATPRLDLSDRIAIDGISDDFDSTEVVFGINEQYVGGSGPCVPGGSPRCPLEESLNDSRWGSFNDVNQIHVTWDAKFLYVAADGITWNNNMMLFFDVTRLNRDHPGAGLASLVNVNSWRRNISFANDFVPDFFLATWDGNSTPQLWTYTGPRTVAQVPTASFTTVATFSAGSTGRAMEAAIPWSIVLQSDSVMASPAYGDTVPVIPAGFDSLRLIACITAGPDGTGSPDSAPDNFGGLQVDGNAPATLDNFAIVPLDLLDPTGRSAPDGVPDMPGDGQDFSIDVKQRVRFYQRPPVQGVFFSLANVIIEQGVVAPAKGRDLQFRIVLDQQLSAEQAQGRNVELSAEIYDIRGVRKRVLYGNRRVPALQVSSLPTNHWDGRDDQGRLVDGGIYVLRVVVEPNQGKLQRSFAVIR